MIVSDFLAVGDSAAGELIFYEAAVQVIPTLLVALVIEARAFRLGSGKDRIDRVSAVAIPACIFVAESLAFAVLLGNLSPAAWIETLLSFAIGAELGIMILIALRPRLDEERGPTSASG